MRGQIGIQVKHLIPIWIQCLLYHRRRVSLFTSHRRDGEGIRESYETTLRQPGHPIDTRLSRHRLELTEHIAFVQSIGGNDYSQ